MLAGRMSARDEPDGTDTSKENKVCVAANARLARKQGANTEPNPNESHTIKTSTVEGQYGKIMKNLKVGECFKTSILAHDSPQFCGWGHVNPRFYSHDLASPEEIKGLNGNQTISLLVFSGRNDVIHPCPLQKFYRPTAHGPIKIQSRLPIFTETEVSKQSDNMKTGDKTDYQHDTTPRFVKVGDYFKQTFLKNAESNGEVIDRVNLSEAIELISPGQFPDLDYIIPYGISLKVLETKGLPPVEVCLAASFASELITTEGGFVSQEKCEWSISDTVVFKNESENTIRKKTGINRRLFHGKTKEEENTDKKAFRAHAVITEKNCGEQMNVFKINQSLVEHGDFSRWLAILPSIFAKETDTNSIQKDIQILKGNVSIDVYLANVSDDPQTQLFSVWLWLSVREEAIAYFMSMEGINPKFIDALKYGVSDDTNNTESKNRKLVIPVDLLSFYIGRNFYRHDINQIIMPISKDKNLDIIYRPLHIDSLYSPTYTESMARPTLLIELSIWFDPYTGGKTKEKPKGEKESTKKRLDNEAELQKKYVDIFLTNNDGDVPKQSLYLK